MHVTWQRSMTLVNPIDQRATIDCIIIEQYLTICLHADQSSSSHRLRPLIEQLTWQLKCITINVYIWIKILNWSISQCNAFRLTLLYSVHCTSFPNKKVMQNERWPHPRLQRNERTEIEKVRAQTLIIDLEVKWVSKKSQFRWPVWLATAVTSKMQKYQPYYHAVWIKSIKRRRSVCFINLFCSTAVHILGFLIVRGNLNLWVEITHMSNATSPIWVRLSTCVSSAQKSSLPSVMSNSVDP